MKISINAGHTKSGAGYGAVYKGFKESDITRAVANELIKQLKAKGHTVYNSTVDKAESQQAYLNKAVQQANNSQADLLISLHCNASTKHTGYGCECWTWKGQQVKQAVNICEELNKLGFRNRGIKDGSNFYLIRKTRMCAIIVEIFFLDNEKDRKLYTSNGYKKIAQAIANSIRGNEK
jgi:N-acetylmuramoyl-L-alanine amidase